MTPAILASSTAVTFGLMECTTPLAAYKRGPRIDTHVTQRHKSETDSAALLRSMTLKLVRICRPTKTMTRTRRKRNTMQTTTQTKRTPTTTNTTKTSNLRYH